MGRQGVLGHQLFGHLFGQTWLKPSRDVDGGQFILLKLPIGGQFLTLTLKVSLFCV
jgi:hypothetical protein